jgi:hypothetical protein
MTRSGKGNRFSRRPGGVALVWISKKGVLPIIGPRTGAQRRQSRRAGEPPNNFAVPTRRARFRWAFLTICFPMLPCKTGSPAEKLEQFEHPRPALTNIRNNLRISARVTRQPELGRGVTLPGNARR